ncbi:hypothetical protein Bca101_028019 [Brassica carinata]
MEGELLQEDWEVVIERSAAPQEDEENPKSLEEEIEDGTTTQGMVTFDYFSIENSNRVCRVDADAVDEDGSVRSGSPGWIEPSSDAPYGPKLFSELWSDSSIDDLDNDDVLGLEKSDESVEEKSVSNDSSGGEGRMFVWWKIPIENVLKYCVFRVNPIWSFSVAAAAVVGFVILGRRLYHMMKNRKSPRTLQQLKVLLDDDDKKVVNEAAISLVKRVPMIRPALPSSVVGINQWSMMSLR